MSIEHDHYLERIDPEEVHPLEDAPVQEVDILVPELRPDTDTPLNAADLSIINHTLATLINVSREEDAVISQRLLNGENYYSAQLSRRLLTHEEEAVVTRAYYRTSHELSIYEEMLSIQELNDSDREQIEIRVGQLREIKEASEKEILTRNLRWVVKSSDRYYQYFPELDRDDLRQEGNMGLMRALEKYRPPMGFRFTTYSTWWIKQSISRYIEHNISSIRLPAHVRKRLQEVSRAEELLQKESGNNRISNHAIAKSLGWETEVVEDARTASRVANLTSLNAPAGTESDASELGDLLEDHRSDEVERLAHLRDLRDQLALIFENLKDKERDVLTLKYGLNDGKMRTLEDVAKEFGVSRERIRQIEQLALRKLRRYSREINLDDFID